MFFSTFSFYWVQALSRGGELSQFAEQTIYKIFSLIKDSASSLVNHNPLANIDSNKIKLNATDKIGNRSVISRSSSNNDNSNNNSSNASSRSSTDNVNNEIIKRKSVDFSDNNHSTQTQTLIPKGPFTLWDFNRFLFQTGSRSLVNDTAELRKFLEGKKRLRKLL